MIKTQLVPASTMNFTALLDALIRTRKQMYDPSSEYQTYYKEYRRRIFSKDVAFEQLNEAKRFINAHEDAFKESGFIEAMMVNDAAEILRHREFVMSRHYLLITLPTLKHSTTVTNSRFIATAELIAERYKKISEYVCISIWNNYDQSNPLKTFFNESNKVYSDSFDDRSMTGEFDDQGTLPETNSNFITLLKKQKERAAIFFTDNPDLSAYLLGRCPKFSDHPAPVLGQVLQENFPCTAALKSGYGTLLSFDFPNKKFKSLM
jgi:hypothetical protein